MVENITFEHSDANQTWPDGIFDVVSMIDVMPHFPTDAQRPVFFAPANRMHNLVMARRGLTTHQLTRSDYGVPKMGSS